MGGGLMGWLSRLFRGGYTQTTGGRIEYIPPEVATVLGMDVAQLYRSQPHLRTVVGFLGRNIAQIGLHAFVRESDTNRVRLHDDPLARFLAMPAPNMTMFELMRATVSHQKLYDIAVWMLQPTVDTPSGWKATVIPPSWLGRTSGPTEWEWEQIEIRKPGKQPRWVSTSQLLVFPGWDPVDPTGYTSPVDALRLILAEQIHAYQFREQLWRRGGRARSWIYRPKDAPAWSAEARQRFQASWRDRWTGSGPDAGGTPLIEDGMELRQAGFSAREEEWVESTKLSLAQVASVYHVNPTMVGLLDNANFSNVRVFRQMLYGETLGPDLVAFQQRLTHFLVPRLTDRADVYVDFNIQAKLSGSFEEQAAVLSSSVGRPWMTADEARARLNLPALGGDAAVLVTPLNVLVGGQASPRDSAPKADPAQIRSLSGPVNIGQVKALTRTVTGVSIKASDAESIDGWREKTREVLTGFLKRQRSSVVSKLGAGSAAWWDGERWDRELAQALDPLIHTAGNALGAEQVRALAGSDDAWDPAMVDGFLAAMATKRATWINDATKRELDKALDGMDPGEDTPVGVANHVFDVAEATRVQSASGALMSAVAGFVTVEAGLRLAGNRATKTWLVTSGNPRASHAVMHGETVPVSENFSNGAKWPGDPGLGVDEVAGCMCDLEMTIP